jgi:hypothetical protein
MPLWVEAGIPTVRNAAEGDLRPSSANSKFGMSSVKDGDAHRVQQGRRGS